MDNEDTDGIHLNRSRSQPVSIKTSVLDDLMLTG